MCICINCIYVHRCSTYSFITMQHYNIDYHQLQNNSFHPFNPILNANYLENNNEIQIDWDVIECLSFLEKPGYWQNSSQ
uniref:Ycf34 n=1 Tax=Liagora brachyclada TaxID=1884665 RepID=A0A1G4P059_9FLOR|nr:Hypothetical protein ycf34 [Liagora brachyclada]SCW24176.1 Hypothetical protein ycf34 [Liagora brachyclada]